MPPLRHATALETDSVVVPPEALEIYESALGSVCGTVDFFLDEAAGRWTLEGVKNQGAGEAELAAARTRAVAQATQQQIVAGIQANGMRPPEGAANAGSGMPVQFDPRKLTKQQRDEIRARVNRGEKITF